MTRRTFSRLGRLAPLLRTGLIGGVLVAALVYPFAALAGLSLKAGADAIDSVPRELLISPSPQT